jgi:hypothetical protein
MSSVYLNVGLKKYGVAIFDGAEKNSRKLA